MSNLVHIEAKNFNDVEQLYVLPINEYFIIYSPLKAITALTDKTAVSYLYDYLIKKQENQAKKKAIDTILNALQESTRELPGEPAGNPDPYFLGLIPTRACNGACHYCDFEHVGRRNKKMSYKMAIAAIDWMASRMKQLNKKKLEVHFFGGEPLYAPDVVSVAVHYARMIADQYDLLPYFEVSTNGLVSDKITRFVTDHINAVVLSLDGPEDIQNRQRPMRNKQDSFEPAVRFARAVSESNTELYLRACISNVSVRRMPEITDWFCRTFRPSIINFENLKSNKGSRDAGLLEPDPYMFAEQFLRSLQIADKYNVTVLNSSFASEKPQFSSCPVGKDTLIVTPEGEINSCYLLPNRWEERGLDLSVGKMKAGGMHISQEKIAGLRDLVKKKPRCTSCFCKWICAGGCHVDVTYPGSPVVYDNYCRQTRILGIIDMMRKIDQPGILEVFLGDEQQLRKFSMQRSDKLTDWSNHES
jgi:uncharacterized protein